MQNTDTTNVLEVLRSGAIRGVGEEIRSSVLKEPRPYFGKEGAALHTYRNVVRWSYWLFFATRFTNYRAPNRGFRGAKCLFKKEKEAYRAIMKGPMRTSRADWTYGWSMKSRLPVQGKIATESSRGPQANVEREGGWYRGC